MIKSKLNISDKEYADILEKIQLDRKMIEKEMDTQSEQEAIINVAFIKLKTAYEQAPQDVKGRIMADFAALSYSWSDFVNNA